LAVFQKTQNLVHFSLEFLIFTPYLVLESYTTSRIGCCWLESRAIVGFSGTGVVNYYIVSGGLAFGWGLKAYKD